MAKYADFHIRVDCRFKEIPGMRSEIQIVSVPLTIWNSYHRRISLIVQQNNHNLIATDALRVAVVMWRLSVSRHLLVLSFCSEIVI